MKSEIAQLAALETETAFVKLVGWDHQNAAQINESLVSMIVVFKDQMHAFFGNWNKGNHSHFFMLLHFLMMLGW